MKKLLTVVSFVAIAAGANAKITEGFNAGASFGIAQNTLKMKNQALFTSNKNKKALAANLGLRLGHTFAIKEKYFAGVNLMAGYNFANTTVAKNNAPATEKLHYKPRFNFGLGAQFGMAATEKLNTYLGLNFLRENSRLETKSAVVGNRGKATLKVYTLTPLLGVSGDLSEKASYFAEAGYKVTLSKSLTKKTGTLTAHTKKDFKSPRGFVANVGVSYAF